MDRAGQVRKNAATGALRCLKALFNARCRSRKPAPFLFWPALMGCGPRTVLHGALARPVERPARPKDAAGVIYRVLAPVGWPACGPAQVGRLRPAWAA